MPRPYTFVNGNLSRGRNKKMVSLRQGQCCKLKQVPAKVGPFPFHMDWELEESYLLECLHFKQNAPQVLEKTVLSGKRFISLGGRKAFVIASFLK